jgi:DNA-binding LacI/PurR family transcriptional regulator
MATRQNAANNRFSRTTLMDLARESGFSPSTISIVLNEAPLSQNIAAKTKEHIRQVAKRMGYRPDAFARSLRKRRSHTIGVMIFDISDPFCTLILQGIEKTLSLTEFLPFIMDAHNQREQFERYLAMLLEYRVEGLIVIANWLFIDIDLLSELERHRIPAILVGTEMRSGPIGSVLVDNEQGGYLALEHLYSLGHRKIAFIRGPRKLWDSSRRWDGVLRFAADTGLKLSEQWVVGLTGSSDSNSSFEEGIALTHAMMERNPGFTALLAFDDLASFGAVRALREAGLRVPEDCSVLGFDDVPYAALSSPSLSTIRQPMEQMGLIAVERILKEIQDGESTEMQKGKVELLAPELLQRESTARLPSKPKRLRHKNLGEIEA